MPPRSLPPTVGPRRGGALVGTLVRALCGVLLPVLVTSAHAQEEPVVIEPAPRPAGPRIEIDTPAHDWGKVERGTIAEHTFTVRNVGSETLELLRFLPG